MGKWDFDLDEMFFFFIAGLIAIMGFLRWYVQIMRRRSSGRSVGIRVLLAVIPVIAAAGLWVVLTNYADPVSVVGQLDYQLLFLSGGLALIWIVGWIMPLFGISPWDDGVERANPAAAVVVCGAVIGAMAIYTGANIGAGPTIWTTLMPAFAGICAWLVVWQIVELVSGQSEYIAIDRDYAAGLRLAGFLVSSGIVLGRACAGDWTGWHETFSDLLRIGWPVILLVVVAIVAGLVFRPTPEYPQPDNISRGLLPMVLMLTLALIYVAAIGRPDIGKHIVTYEQYMGQP